MRRVVSVKVPPGCLPSAPVREYELSVPVDQELMHRLAEGSELRFFPGFPRPFFRIERPGAFSTQAVLGASVLRVTFSPRSTEATRAELLEALGGEADAREETEG